MAGFSTAPEVSLKRVLNASNVSQVQDIDATYEVNSCADWIRKNGYSKVCLQFPDGLLVDSVDVALAIERHVTEKVFILGDTSYGSCCVDEVAAQHVDADAIIHFGHACLSPFTHLPVFYIFPKAELDVNEFIVELRNLNLRRPTLVLYDVSYFHVLDKIRNSIPDELKPLIVLSELDIASGHKHPCGSNCQLLAEKEKHSTLKLARAYCPPEDGFELIIYIGAKDNPNLRNFLLAIKGMKCLRYSNERGFDEVTEASVWKLTSYHVERLKNARFIGILVGTLGVEGYLEALAHVKKLCNRAKKKSYTIAVGKPNPEKLANFPEIEVFVAIACAEAEFGNTKRFIQPIVGVFEVELAFNGNRSWDLTLSKDFRDLIPGGCEYIECTEARVTDNETVSLASSKIQTYMSVNSDSSDLAVRPEMALANASSGSSFARTWYGLEQSLGDTDVTMATVGRTGIASGYDNETEMSD